MKDGEERPRCIGCGRFLSAIRVLMNIRRCWKCDQPSRYEPPRVEPIGNLAALFTSTP